MDSEEYKKYLIEEFGYKRKQLEKLTHKLFNEFEKYQKELDNYTPQDSAIDEFIHQEEFKTLKKASEVDE